MTDSEKLILEVLRNIAGGKINIAFAIWGILEKDTEVNKGALLRFAAERWDQEKTSSAIEKIYVTQDERKSLAITYGKLSDEILNTLSSQNLTEDDFYSQLYDCIDSPIFPSHKARAFALYNILIDKLIPYFQLEQGVSMSDELFQTFKDKHKERLLKLSHIQARTFDQKTKKASNVLSVLEEIEEDQGKIVALALLLAGSGSRATPSGLSGLLGALADD